jgi:hypothetical protein
MAHKCNDVERIVEADQLVVCVASPTSCHARDPWNMLMAMQDQVETVLPQTWDAGLVSRRCHAQ